MTMTITTMMTIMIMVSRVNWWHLKMDMDIRRRRRKEGRKLLRFVAAVILASFHFSPLEP